MADSSEKASAYPSAYINGVATQGYTAFRVINNPDRWAHIEIKSGVFYNVMSGWKQWESTDSTVIVDGADGDSFEIIKFKVIEFASLLQSATLIVMITAILFNF